MVLAPMVAGYVVGFVLIVVIVGAVINAMTKTDVPPPAHPYAEWTPAPTPQPKVSLTGQSRSMPAAQPKLVLTNPSGPQSVGVVRQPVPSVPAPSLGYVSEAAAQQDAMRRFPELAKPDSKMNALFLAKYKAYKQSKPEYFSDVGWPVRLAEEVDKLVNQ